MELRHPHGTLLATGKKTAILSPEELPTGEPVAVDGVGVVVLGGPVRMLASEVDRREWYDRHRVRPDEREAWWPGEVKFNFYPVERLGLEMEDWKGGEMPYEMEERDGEYCVVKEGSGETVKCHPSKEKAEAHLAALRINVEAEEKQVTEADLEVAVVPEPATEAETPEETEHKGQIKRLMQQVEDLEAEIAALKAVTKSEGDGDHAEGMDLPGEKARGEGQGQGGEPQGDGGADVCVCPECGAEAAHEKGKPCAEQACPECGAAMRGEDQKEAGSSGGKVEGQQEPEAAPVSEKAGRRLKKPMVQRLKDAFETIKEVLGWAEYSDRETDESLQGLFKSMEKHETGFAVKAGPGGADWLWTWTTNAFKDRDEEIFSTKGLEKYVKEAEAKDDRGAYNLWHVAGTEFADVEAQAVIGRFLVEGGPFRDDARGRAVKAFFQQYPDGHPEHAPEGWGCSPEFRYLPAERKQGVFDNFWITARAVLPRRAAANVQTRGGNIMTLITEKNERMLKEALGEEEFAQLVQRAEEESKELEGLLAYKALDGAKVAKRLRGLADKADGDLKASLEALAEEMEGPAEDDDEEEEKEAETPEIDVNELAAKMVEHFDVDLSAITGEIEALRAELAEMKRAEKSRRADLPRFQLSLEKRASNAEETELDEDDPLLKMGPKETPADAKDSGAGHFFPPKK